MTVVAWDGRTLAADRRMTDGAGLIRTVRKIREWVEPGSGRRVGLAITGDAAAGLEMLEWFTGGEGPETWPKAAREDGATMIVVLASVGGPAQVVQYAKGPYPMTILDERSAWGSGRDFALAGMSLGLNAIQAVELACKFDCYSGGGVDFIEL